MGLFSKEKLVKYGEVDGINIMRFRSRKNNLYGIISEAGNVTLTAKHVAEAQNLHQKLMLSPHPSKWIDLSFRTAGNKPSLVGYTEDLVIRNLKVVVSTRQNPEKITEVPGSLSVILAPTDLMKFIPDSAKHQNLFIPGVSGAPILREGHVIGIIVGLLQEIEETSITALAFNGVGIRRKLTEAGLPFKEFPPQRGW